MRVLIDRLGDFAAIVRSPKPVRRAFAHYAPVRLWWLLIVVLCHGLRRLLPPW